MDAHLRAQLRKSNSEKMEESTVRQRAQEQEPWASWHQSISAHHFHETPWLPPLLPQLFEFVSLVWKHTQIGSKKDKKNKTKPLTHSPHDSFLRNRGHFLLKRKHKNPWPPPLSLNLHIKAHFLCSHWGAVGMCQLMPGLDGLSLRFFPNRRKHTCAPKPTRNTQCF